MQMPTKGSGGQRGEVENPNIPISGQEPFKSKAAKWKRATMTDTIKTARAAS